MSKIAISFPVVLVITFCVYSMVLAASDMGSVRGLVLNKYDSPLADVVMVLVDKKGCVKAASKTNVAGEYFITIQPQEYTLYALSSRAHEAQYVKVIYGITREINFRIGRFSWNDLANWFVSAASILFAFIIAYFAARWGVNFASKENENRLRQARDEIMNNLIRDIKPGMIVALEKGKKYVEDMSEDTKRDWAESHHREEYDKRKKAELEEPVLFCRATLENWFLRYGERSELIEYRDYVRILEMLTKLGQARDLVQSPRFLLEPTNRYVEYLDDVVKLLDKWGA